MLKGLLKDGNKSDQTSSMRFTMVLAAVGAFVMMLSVSAFIIIRAFEETEPEWAAMGVFAIGIAGILTGMGYAKAKQKELEKSEKKEWSPSSR